MPADLWIDIAGYTCLWCGHWATHWYADAPMCCSCHLGTIDRYMEAQAIAVNTAFQKGMIAKYARIRS